MACNCPPCNNCDPCSSSSCPVQLDMACVFYHKNNNEISELDGLGLPNGSSLELIIETIDEKIKQLNVVNFTLPCLRAEYVVNTMQQFAQAVDTKLCILAEDIADAAADSGTILTVNDSATINFTASGTLSHTLTGIVKFSATSPNMAEGLSDGIYVPPQTLSINYTTKELTISDGNTVDLTSLVCGVGGFLGNVSSDPVAVDGQYWWNTASSELKIKVNGTTKVITTT